MLTEIEAFLRKYKVDGNTKITLYLLIELLDKWHKHPSPPLSQSEVEKLAESEFKNVGDEGLFPNHSDKDIWTKGFIAGFTHPQKPSGEWYSRADIDNAIDYGASRIEMDEGKIPYVTLDQFIASLSKENKDK